VNRFIITAIIEMYKNFNAYITKMLEKSKGKEPNPRYLVKKLIQYIDNLEKFYSDKEYRNKLESARYPSLEYVQLEDTYEQDKKVKEKLYLPQNSTIKYEKVKCSKNCRHNTHRYYYAYFWDCDSKKLKKKYIGKKLPLPSPII
jgi:hypothetical protein